MKKTLLLLPLALLLVAPACKKKTHKKPIIKTHKTGLGKHKVDHKKTSSVKKAKAKKPKAKIQDNPNHDLLWKKGTEPKVKIQGLAKGEIPGANGGGILH